MTDPTIQELVEFRKRYGLEAYLLWCVAVADLPAWMLMNLLKIGRCFGPLGEDKYDRKALAELIRRPMCSAALTEIIGRSTAGEHVSLDLVRGIMADHGGRP